MYTCTSFFNLFAHRTVHTFPTVVKLMNGGYRFPSRRQLVNDRNIQIAIQRHRQCTRDRRGSHHQHMWRLYILRPEAGTLRHSEAVLFVNNDQSQRREVHRVFNDRVRTYQDLHVSRQQSGQDRFPSSFL